MVRAIILKKTLKILIGHLTHLSYSIKETEFDTDNYLKKKIQRLIKCLPSLRRAEISSYVLYVTRTVRSITFSIYPGQLGALQSLVFTFSMCLGQQFEHYKVYLLYVFRTERSITKFSSYLLYVSRTAHSIINFSSYLLYVFRTARIITKFSSYLLYVSRTARSITKFSSSNLLPSSHTAKKLDS